MIHLSVAVPLGIDSVFFSFIERLAIHNGHDCLDPLAQDQIELNLTDWISQCHQSNRHHFVIGYRYPPIYWKRLAELASTVIFIADPDGIARQIEQVRLLSVEHGGTGDLPSVIEGLGEALDNSVAMIEWMLSEGRTPTKLIVPARTLIGQPAKCLSRVENFYRHAGIPIEHTCSDTFSKEALPLLMSLTTNLPEEHTSIKQYLTLEKATPMRINAIECLFSLSGD